MSAAVLCCDAVDDDRIRSLCSRYQMIAQPLEPHAVIPGCFWGEPEAGLLGDRLYYRPDTPLHSLLHELAHYVCMTPARRAGLDTNAGGDDAEECAVCYLEVLLADRLPPFSSARCLADMDAWGYSFRQGSARDWFDGDGRDARDWLLEHALILADGTPTDRLRARGIQS